VRIPRGHRRGRDPGPRPAPRASSADQRLLDRRLLARELPLATLNIKDYADFVEHEGFELIPRRRSPSRDGSWSEPQHTGGQRRYRTRTEGPGRTWEDGGDRGICRLPEAGAQVRILPTTTRASGSAARTSQPGRHRDPAGRGPAGRRRGPRAAPPPSCWGGRRPRFRWRCGAGRPVAPTPATSPGRCTAPHCSPRGVRHRPPGPCSSCGVVSGEGRAEELVAPSVSGCGVSGRA
jgi:hypothetical protein